jgi:hypothetical protein
MRDPDDGDAAEGAVEGTARAAVRCCSAATWPVGAACDVVASLDVDAREPRHQARCCERAAVVWHRNCCTSVQHPAAGHLRCGSTISGAIGS